MTFQSDLTSFKFRVLYNFEGKIELAVRKKIIQPAKLI